MSLIAARLSPDHINPRPPSIVRTEGVVSVVASPGESIRRDGASIALGVLEPDEQWGRPCAPVPDGSFALFRADAERIELVADAAASRTIWYAMTAELFVASTSQRAIVALLGDFRANLDAAAWLLSSGSLGPGGGWDGRIARVAPSGRVVLRRASWRLDVHDTGVEAPPAAVPDRAEQQRRLEAIVDDVIGKLDLDYSRWLLPLSGGVDSRGLLLALARTGRDLDSVRCITWGGRDAVDQPGNDARVARDLARRLGVAHEYFAVEPTSEPRERFLERFLVAGEGRVDAMGGYLDGFDIWKRLHDGGVEGIIRGDEAFGWKPVRTELDVRESVCLTLLEDVCGERAARALGLPRQRIPDELAQRAGESLAAWRDRLYRQYRLPVMLAALTDLKTSYVEVVNPFLYARVLAFARGLPDELRTEKALWRSTVDAWSPDVPYATRVAVPSPRALLDDREMLALMLDELGSSRAADLFGAAATARVRAALEASARRAAPGEAASDRSRLGRIFRKAKKRLTGRLHVDSFTLAMRMLIAIRTCALLREDAAAASALGRRERQAEENLAGEIG